MSKFLIKMTDGGIVNYVDDCCWHLGCPTCDFGSEYITEIDITLTSYRVHIKTNQMYDYVLSEGQVMKLFLSEYEVIQSMSEKEFIEWLKEKLCEIVGDDYVGKFKGRCIEEYTVIELR